MKLVGVGVVHKNVHCFDIKMFIIVVVVDRVYHLWG